MTGEFDTHEPRYTGLYIGHVVDRADPEQLGRVRIRIPGLIEPASAWAFPLGTVGGGSDRRGFFAVPEVGAEVGVLFHQGDVDHPYYLCGHWGKPGGATEVLSPARELSTEDVPQVRAFETRRFLLVFDDRAGKEALRIQDKASGDQIEFDGAAMGITVKATSALLLQADGLISIEGTTVVINGRLVLPGGGAI
ncbi:MAG TPA: phage baseplate assembly protein V [Kofleriaceae bacterium]